MRSLMPDPASRWGYRLQRMWLTPLFRALLRTGLPCMIIGGAVYAHVSQPHVRVAIGESLLEARSWVQERPEFMVHLVAIEGVSEETAEVVRKAIHVDFPVSSFDLDLEALRTDVETLSPVKSASLRVRPGGVLEVGVTERVPAMVWRSWDGLKLIDVDGVVLRPLSERGEAGVLPLAVGEGAERAVGEALDLVRAAAPIRDRLRGLRRMGERRWDVVLDRGQVIQLPEEAPVRALERVILLDTAQDLLARDITHVDLRNPRRPTLRLAESGLEELREIRGIELGANVNE
ncbi:MAG: cell division protein FtsQ/DivIB [Pseudomonadota bacterium]